MNILVTTAGRRVSLVRAFQHEAKRLEENSLVFTVDMRPELSPACRISDGFCKVPRVTEPHYIDIVSEYCIQNKIDILIPIIDNELKVLAKNREKLKKEGINVIVSDIELINICNDKRKTIDFFNATGIATPKILDKEDPRFPVYAKPYDGSGTVDNYVFEEAGEVRDIHMENDKLLFFEFLDPEIHDEYTCDLYYDRFYELKCVVPRKRLKTRTGEVIKAITKKTHLVEFIKESLAVIPGARGCITLQLFLNNKTGEIYCIEINPRFGGGYPLSYIAGANYPKWLIEEYVLGTSVEYYEEWEKDLLMLRYESAVFLHDYAD